MNDREKRLWALVKGRFPVRIDLIGRENLMKVFKGKYICSTIPCYSYSEEKPSIEEQGSIQVKLVEGVLNSVKFNLKENQIQLVVAPGKLYQGDVVYLLFLLFTKILQEEGYFIVHGSCIAKENKASLLVGPSESGKTMTSLVSCLEHRFSLVSSDMSLLKREGNEILVIGGTKECSMYPGTIEAVFGEKSKKLLPKSSEGLWEKKIEVSEVELNQLGIQYEQNVALKAIYYLRVQDSVFFDKPLDKVAAKIKALGLLSEWIRGASNLVISTNSLVPSFDTKRAERERLCALEIISASVLQYSLYGNLQKVTEFIAGQNR